MDPFRFELRSTFANAEIWSLSETPHSIFWLSSASWIFPGCCEYHPPVVSIISWRSCGTIESAKTSSSGCRCSNEFSEAAFALGLVDPTDCAQQVGAMEM